MAELLNEDDTDVPSSARPPRWLPTLERELKSRVGWVDEAVSPFARVPQETAAAKPVVPPVVPAQVPLQAEDMPESFAA